MSTILPQVENTREEITTFQGYLFAWQHNIIMLTF